MNIFLNLNWEHSLSWIYYKPERIEQGLIDRTKAIAFQLKGTIHQKINLRGAQEQKWAYMGNCPEAAKRLCKGTFHKGITTFNKYN